MRVLIVHNYYQSHHIGGEDLVVAREIRGLKALLGEENVFEYAASNDDINPRRLIFRLWGDKEHYHNVFQMVKKYQIDVVHIHNFFPLLTPMVFAAAQKAGAVVVHTLHNFRWWCLSGTFYREDKGECEACAEKTIAWPAIQHHCYRDSHLQSAVGALAFSWYHINDYHQYIDAYCVLTEFQREKIKKWVPTPKIYLKPNAIEEPNVQCDLHAKKDFLFVGRLESAKGIELLLSTWQELPDDMILNVVGGANNNSLQKRYQKDNIRFLGQLPHEETLKLIDKAKYFIHPSLAYETFGLTLVEALAHRTPVIALDYGPRGEFIRSGFNGWLTDRQNLRETIVQAFDYQDYDTLANNAFETAKAFYLPTIIEKQIALYQRLVC